jgi:hypothetical protein
MCTKGTTRLLPTGRCCRMCKALSFPTSRVCQSPGNSSTYNQQCINALYQRFVPLLLAKTLAGSGDICCPRTHVADIVRSRMSATERKQSAVQVCAWHACRRNALTPPDVCAYCGRQTPAQEMCTKAGLHRPMLVHSMTSSGDSRVFHSFSAPSRNPCRGGQKGTL